MSTRRNPMGVAACTCLAVVMGTSALRSAEARGPRSAGRLRVVSVSVEGLGQVALNQVVEIRFNAAVARSSLSDGSITVVPREGTDGPRPGTLTQKGNVVRFLPDLPTHALDPDDPGGDFFPTGSPRDDAFANGTFRPATDYRVLIAGGADKPTVQSVARGGLRRSVTADFRTADRSGVAPLFLPEEFADVAPQSVLFTSPPDRVTKADHQYGNRGGTPSVSEAVRVALFLKALPLDPESVRVPGAVRLTRVAPLGPGEAPVDVAGDALVRQDRDSVELVFRPRDPLDQLSSYALRVDERVTTLATGFTLEDQVERRRARDAFEFLALARSISPSTPPELLPNPPSDLISDWPALADQDELGVIKRNLLETGDTRPWEIDPRVYAIFTTKETGRPLPGLSVVEPTKGGRRAKSLPRITRIATPLGLQGAAGAGEGVVIPFNLADRRSRTAGVEAEFGFDADADGVVDDREFRPATLVRIDPRDTSLAIPWKRRGTPFRTAPGTGRSNALVWISTLDLGRSTFLSSQPVLLDGKREAEDPDNPGHPIFDSTGGGIVFRIRTVHGRKRASDWVTTGPFDVDNDTAPSLTFDAVTIGDPVLLQWTAIDADSEDLNGNGTFDLLEGEDVDGDGVFDGEPLVVAFDFHVLAAGEDPTRLTETARAALDWQPCTRAAGLGDPDDGVPSSPVGRQYTFAWDAAADAVGVGEAVLLRARAVDGLLGLGRWVYLADAVTPVP